MANIVGEGEINGRATHVYDNGMELYADTGRIAKPAPHTVINSQNSTVLLRRRQEKAAALLRDRIKAAHNTGDMTLVRSSAEAFAESGALLYEEIVLNTEAYPRDRMEAWEKLGKYAQVLPSDIRKQDDASVAGAAAAGAAAGSAAAVLKFLSDVADKKAQIHETIDGEIKDE